MTPDDPRHGERRGYYAHRADGEQACEPCKRAAASAEQRYVLARMRGVTMRIPAIGTRRRLRALQALGWTITELAEQLGEDRQRVEKWCNESRVNVYRSTAARVDDLYERLCMTWSDGPYADRNRAMAARKGYLLPLAWINIDDPDEVPDLKAKDDGFDDVVVERLMAGHKMRSTRADKVEAMRRWMAAGRSQRSLCRMHGWQEARYVVREDGAA